MGAVFNRRAVLTAQRLYLIEGWKAGDIAEKLDVTPDQMYRLIRSKGWGKKKKEQEAKIDKIAESTDAALIEEDQEFRESLKIRAMQTGMGGNVTQNVQNNTLNIMYVQPSEDVKQPNDGEITEI